MASILRLQQEMRKHQSISHRNLHIPRYYSSYVLYLRFRCIE